MNAGTVTRWWRSSRYPSAWVAAFAGPIAWFANLETVYALTPPACAAGNRLGLHVATIVFLAVTAAGGVMARANWSWAGDLNPADTDHGPTAMVAFLSLVGLASASLFALAILAQWLTIVSLDPCPP